MIDDLKEHIFKCNECEYISNVCEYCMNGENLELTQWENFIECARCLKTGHMECFDNHNCS